MALNSQYYVTNVSGATYDLTTSQSEALVNNLAHRLTPTASYVGGTNFDMVINVRPYQPTAPTIDAAAFMNETVGIIRKTAAWARALGIDSAASGFAAVVSDDAIVHHEIASRRCRRQVRDRAQWRVLPKLGRRGRGAG